MPATRFDHVRRLTRPLAALAAALTATVLLAGPAAAHDALSSSDPQDGATLTAVPGEISLTFTAEPLEVSPEIVVTDESGSVVMDDAPQVDGFDVLQQLPEDLPSGVYDVAWRVVSSDGHPIDGAFSFTLDLPADAATGSSESASESSESTTEASETEASEATDTDTATATITQGGDADDADQGTSWGLIGGAVGIVALIVAIAVLAVRRARDPNGPPGQH